MRERPAPLGLRAASLSDPPPVFMHCPSEAIDANISRSICSSVQSGWLLRSVARKTRAVVAMCCLPAVHWTLASSSSCFVVMVCPLCLPASGRCGFVCRPHGHRYAQGGCAAIACTNFIRSRQRWRGCRPRRTGEMFSPWAAVSTKSVTKSGGECATGFAPAAPALEMQGRSGICAFPMVVIAIRIEDPIAMPVDRLQRRCPCKEHRVVLFGRPG